MRRVVFPAAVVTLLLMNACGSEQAASNSSAGSPQNTSQNADGGTGSSATSPTPLAGRIPHSVGVATSAVEADGSIVMLLQRDDDGPSLATLETSAKQTNDLPSTLNFGDRGVTGAGLAPTPDGGFVAATENETILSSGPRGSGTGAGAGVLALAATEGTIVAGTFDPNDQQRSQLMFATYGDGNIGVWTATVSVKRVNGIAASGDQVVTWGGFGSGIRRSEDGGRTWGEPVAQNLDDSCELVAVLPTSDDQWMPVCSDGQVGSGPFGEWSFRQLDFAPTKLAPDAHPLTRTDLAGKNAQGGVIAAKSTSTGVALLVSVDGFELPGTGEAQPGELQIYWLSADLTISDKTFVLEDDGSGLPSSGASLVELDGEHLLVTSAFNESDGENDTAWVVAVR